MSNLTVWLIAGALLGSIVGLSLLADGQHRVLSNVVVATGGSAIGGLFVCPLIGVPATLGATFDDRALVVSLISTLFFLAIANLTRDATD